MTNFGRLADVHAEIFEAQVANGGFSKEKTMAKIWARTARSTYSSFIQALELRVVVPFSFNSYGLLMVTIHSVSQSAFLLLAFGLPMLAAGLGAYTKPRVLIAAFFVTFFVMTVCLTTHYLLVETGAYIEATGLEGLTLFVVPILYLVSLLVSIFSYLAVARLARRRRKL